MKQQVNKPIEIIKSKFFLLDAIFERVAKNDSL